MARIIGVEVPPNKRIDIALCYIYGIGPSNSKVILAKAKISIKASLERTNSTSTTHTYSHKISKGRFGHVRYVSWGKRVTWTKYRDNATCTTTKLASGVISFPSVEEGWYYWETRS